MAKKKTSKPRERTERRFLPQAQVNLKIVYGIGAVGAAVLGAGVFEQFGNAIRKIDLEPAEWAPWLLAAGAVIVGVAIWIGTSTEAAIRVGIAGIAEERNPMRRMPWWNVEDVSGTPDAIVVRGKDEHDAPMSVRFTRRAMSGALAWVVREAKERAPEQFELSDETVEQIGKPSKQAGEVVACPPLQVVGKRCADSDKVISYEPDARVCPRCERIYHKDHVPKTCVCGASLAEVKALPESGDSAEA
ncbi:MAG TPA: hypothetical protein VGH87_29375 [Polyangiaceae bacterium]|jgi:hypothetical protein|nr:hypothetical protein [Polyangiaceae bacterium]